MLFCNLFGKRDSYTSTNREEMLQRNWRHVPETTGSMVWSINGRNDLRFSSHWKVTRNKEKYYDFSSETRATGNTLFCLYSDLLFLASGINLFGPKPSTEQYLADFSANNRKIIARKRNRTDVSLSFRNKNHKSISRPRNEENLISFLKDHGLLFLLRGIFLRKKKRKIQRKKNNRELFFSEDNSEIGRCFWKETPKNAPIIPQKKTIRLFLFFLDKKNQNKKKIVQRKLIVSSFSDGLFFCYWNIRNRKRRRKYRC